MATIKIADLKSRVGTVIPGVKGIIVSVFPPKEGKGEHGAWKLQNISIEEDGVKTQVTLSGLETLSENDKGKEIQFESKGTKFGLKGVSVEEREHNGKTYMGVKVTKTAQIRWVGASESVQEDAVDNDSEPKTATELNKALDNHFKTPRNIKTPQQRMGQFIGLFYLSLKEVRAQNDPDLDAIMNEDNLFKAAMFAAIQGVKEGLADKIQVEEHDEF